MDTDERTLVWWMCPIQVPVLQSLDQASLVALANRQLELTIVKYVQEKLARPDADEDAIIAGLPQGVRALYLTRSVEAELIEGGFTRYYTTRAGRYAEQAVTSLAFFAAHDHAAVMREANRAYAEEKESIDALAREGRESPRLRELEDRFFDGLSLSRIRIRKIRRQPWLFCDA